MIEDPSLQNLPPHSQVDIYGLRTANGMPVGLKGDVDQVIVCTASSVTSDVGIARSSSNSGCVSSTNDFLPLFEMAACFENCKELAS